MKDYFISFTYIRENSEGQQTSNPLLTFEIISLSGNTLSKRNEIITTLGKMGYKGVNILNMSAL